jgi:hypothetical protein
MKLRAILTTLCLITLLLPLCLENIDVKKIQQHKVIGAYGSEDEGVQGILEGYYDVENRTTHIEPWGAGGC